MKNRINQLQYYKVLFQNMTQWEHKPSENHNKTEKGNYSGNLCLDLKIFSHNESRISR